MAGSTLRFCLRVAMRKRHDGAGCVGLALHCRKYSVVNSIQSLVARFFVTFGLAGCAAPMELAPDRTPAARLAVANLTGYAWRVSLLAGGKREQQTVQLPPYGTVELDCPAGEYLLEQARLAADGTAMSGRKFPMELGAGQAYRWPIATLWSAATDGAEVVSGAEAPRP